MKRIESMRKPVFLFLIAFVPAFCLPPAGLCLTQAGAGNLIDNASFTEWSGGLPLKWEGAGILPETASPGEPGVSGAIRLSEGGRISQRVPAQAGMDYTATVLAHTQMKEEKLDSWVGAQYRSGAVLDLIFHPSGELRRVEMISPFGESRKLVDYSIGGTAPAGTDSVEVVILAKSSDITVAHAHLEAHKPSYTDFKLKDLHIETKIVSGGSAGAKIVVPVSGVYDRLGVSIAAEIRRLTGVSVPVVADEKFELCRDQRLDENLIVLGNRNTSSVISDLYDLYYCIIDLLYPGEGGSVVRSLHNPFGDGRNIILVGASDDEGMEKASDVFMKALGEAGSMRGKLSLG